MAVVDDVDFRAAGAFPVEGELIPQISGAIAIATGRGSRDAGQCVAIILINCESNLGSMSG